MMIDGFETIVGEARYAFHPETESFEFGLSIDDRWQGHGIGTALLKNLECRAAAFGARSLFGDTLRSNDGMMGLARKSGYRLHQSSRRLEAGALREGDQPRAEGHPLRELAHRGCHASVCVSGDCVRSSLRGASDEAIHRPQAVVWIASLCWQ